MIPNARWSNEGLKPWSPKALKTCSPKIWKTWIHVGEMEKLACSRKLYIGKPCENHKSLPQIANECNVQPMKYSMGLCSKLRKKTKAKSWMSNPKQSWTCLNSHRWLPTPIALESEESLKARSPNTLKLVRLCVSTQQVPKHESSALNIKQNWTCLNLHRCHHMIPNALWSNEALKPWSPKALKACSPKVWKPWIHGAMEPWRSNRTSKPCSL